MSFEFFCTNIGQKVSAVDNWKNPPQKQKSLLMRNVVLRRGEETQCWVLKK